MNLQANTLYERGLLQLASVHLSIALEALSHNLFKPLEGVGLKLLCLKMVLLVALATAKHMSDLQA